MVYPKSFGIIIWFLTMVSQTYLKHVETTKQALESLHWCREWDTKKNQKANPCKTLPRTLNMDCEKPKVAKYLVTGNHGFPRHHPSYPSWDQQPSYFQPKAPGISQRQVEGRLRQIPAPCDPSSCTIAGPSDHPSNTFHSTLSIVNL